MVENGDLENPTMAKKEVPTMVENDFSKCTRLKSLTRTKNKKAQIKIQQTAFMLIAVTLFFVLVGLFVLSFKLSNMKKNAEELEQENAMLLATKLANSPEFSCENSFGGEKGACIDADKVMMLKQNIEEYTDFWGVSNIRIRKVYPAEEEKECTISNYPDCTTINLFGKEVQGYDASNFVSLCRKEGGEGYSYDKCELARIIINYES